MFLIAFGKQCFTLLKPTLSGNTNAMINKKAQNVKQNARDSNQDRRKIVSTFLQEQ